MIFETQSTQKEKKTVLIRGIRANKKKFGTDFAD